MAQTTRTRLQPEIFDLPVEKMRAGWYTDAYFNHARDTLLQDERRPRVVMQFPANANDMLLSGTLAGGQALSNHPLVLDVTLGKGHVVMFALRPFWRWQTQGTYFLAFNAILNWNHLDAGKAEPKGRESTATAQDGN